MRAHRLGFLVSSILAAGLPTCGPVERSPDRVAAPQLDVPARLDHFGYRPEDPRVAVFSSNPGPSVKVRDESGATVFTVPADGGSIVARGRDGVSGDDVWWVDFTPFVAPGRYLLFGPSSRRASYEFRISSDVYRGVLRAALRTYYLQRCGVPKPAAFAGAWADGERCHRSDVLSGPAPGQTDRGRRDLSGGWHDAGDYNKYLSYSVSNAVRFLLLSWENNPGAFPDNALGIPESGNGVSDLLDEVRWELDFLLKMQLPDGSVLSRLHAGEGQGGVAPPSADAAPRAYSDPTLESGAVFAGSTALSARVFAEAGQTEYADRLRLAALRAWHWLERQADSDERAWAAAEIFRLEPALVSARAAVDKHHPADWSHASLGPAAYDTYAALTYVQTAGATASVVAAMRGVLAQTVDDVFAADDSYRNGLPISSYHWGSNSVRAAQGVFLLEAARLGVVGTRSAGECRRHALDILHFFHGQNPLGMVYLTNMAAEGGEHSSWQFFHLWFGQSRSQYSRERFVGKPLSVLEPEYPYFIGTDNHGVSDDKASRLGPPPGFLVGGPNRAYSGDARPPRCAVYPSRAYRDWNDQVVWTARTWEITESSIGYEGPYVALLATFVGH
jgi:hypothetical protein